MGKLVLTRRAGESVKLVEANGDTWLVRAEKVSEQGSWLTVVGPEPFYSYSWVRVGGSDWFAGGSLELRPTKRRWPDRAVLAFDFPRDVKIVRTEIA